MGKVLYGIIAILIVITGYILFSGDDEKSANTNIVDKEQVDTPNNKLTKIGIKVKIVEKESKKEKTTNQANNNHQTDDKLEDDDFSNPKMAFDSPSNSNQQDDEVPSLEEIKDYVPISKTKVGDYEVSIVTDIKGKRSEIVPPAVPFLVSGKIKGKSFTIALPATQKNSDNVIKITDNKGNTFTKRVPPNDLVFSGTVNVGEVVENSNDNNENNEENSADTQNQESGGMVPPMAPEI